MTPPPAPEPPDTGGPEVPRPDPGLTDPAPAPDVAFGAIRVAWPWLAAGAVVLGLIGVLLWGANRPDDPSFDEASATTAPAETVTTPADGLDFAEIGRMVGEGCLKLLVADTGDKRASGLRFREAELDRVDGMLFIFPEPQAGGVAFTMAGVVRPLDIGFYDTNGVVLGRQTMEPCAGTISECPRYEAPGGFRFALETAVGSLPDGPIGAACTP